MYKPNPDRRRNARSGQSLIESCLAAGLICLIFMGMVEISRLITAYQILNYAATCGARARTVGFNDWMVKKAVRTAAIPNAGKMITPQFDKANPFIRSQMDLFMSGRPRRPGSLWSSLLAITPRSEQYAIERSRIPEYLGSPYDALARNILDYSDWHTISIDPETDGLVPQTETIQLISRQSYTNWLFGNVHKSFYMNNTVNLSGKSELENHCRLYLEN